jgi:ABC-type multidrug transport system ATPase subunit
VTATIEIEGLTKRFGPVTAVNQLDFTVDSGQVVGFLGPNGAGKTTTLRMLLGLITPSAGRATIDGQPYRELDQPLRHVVAMLEASSFHPGRSGIDHLCPWRSWRSQRTPSGSKPLAGSSKMSNSGSARSAMPRPSRWRIPRE